MERADLAQVVSIESEVFSDPWSLSSFIEDLDNAVALPMVLEIENKILGYANLYLAADELQIGNFAISPSYRRRGAGKYMMNEIIAIAQKRKFSEIILEVRESNFAAINLYSSFGCETIDVRKNYYRSPRENAIVMIKEI